MRALSASDLLTIWERGAGAPPVEQALAILNVAFAQASNESLAQLDIAQRDLRLLQLRALTFGPQIQGLATCLTCHERLELGLDLRDLPASISPLPDPVTMELPSSETSFRIGDYEVTFRLPNSADLSIVNEVTDETSRRQRLLEACITSAQRGDKSLMINELPVETLNAIAERMSLINPLADLTVPVTCPACGNTSEIVFDIVTFFWGEINAWSMKLMREVHTLASAYGWREADILATSAWRRQRYLEMIGA